MIHVMTESKSGVNRIFDRIIAKKWIVLIAVIVLIGSGYLIKRRLSSSSQQVQYQTAQAERGTIVVALTTSGQVQSTNSKEVDTQASGVVSKVYVHEGQLVKAGSVIATIDLDLPGKQKAQQALASYQSAKNQLAQAQTQMYSLQSQEFAANQAFMNDKGANNNPSAADKSDPNYIQENATWLAAEANYKNQQAVIAQAQTSLSQAWLSYQQTSNTIYAPISGTITGLDLQEGSVIQGSSSSNSTSAGVASTKIANILTKAHPTIKLSLTEIDIPKIKVGDKATVTFDALSDKTFVGKVLSIDNVGSVSSNVTSYPVIIQLIDQTDDILPNMSATANIITDSKSDVIIVPSSAIQTVNGASTVQVMKNGTPQNVAVTVGLTSDSQAEILSGIHEGDEVVTATIQPSSTTRTTTGTSPFSTLGGRGGGNATFTSGAAVRITR